MVLFSIITVCKNPGVSLQETIVSLEQQTCRDFELIVVDGGSTDGTLDYIRRRRDIITDYISENDRGIYDAMNKGVSMATGKYVYFLNCGDSFYNAFVLEKVAAACGHVNRDVIYGDSNLIDTSARTEVLKRHESVDKYYLFHKPINHQAIFAKRSLFSTVGNFDISYVVKADHDWILRCFVAGAVFVYLPVVISNYVLHGFAYQNRSKYRSQEKQRIQKAYYHPLAAAILRMLNKINFVPGPAFRRALSKSI